MLIDLNPVRARITNDPARYRWSNCVAHCGQHEDPLLSLHPAQAALGGNAQDRAQAYRQLLNEAISEDELTEIRAYLQQQRAWGRDDFRAKVQAKTKRFANIRPAHRRARPSQIDK